MLAALCSVLVLAQAPDPARVEQAKRAQTLRTLGFVTLAGAGVSREVRNVFGAVQTWWAYQGMLYQPAGDRGVQAMQSGIIVSWVSTAALVVAAVTFLVIGIATDPGDG